MKEGIYIKLIIFLDNMFDQNLGFLLFSLVLEGKC